MSSKKNSKETVGVYEYARVTGLALNTVYQQIYLGKLPAQKMGRKWQIKRTLMESSIKP
jgi:excisionase family DNA binding protein